MKIACLLDKQNDWIAPYVKQYCETSNPTLHIDYNAENLKEYDIVFILGYTQILEKSFLESNGLCLVIHESDLPDGKGFSPLQWQILENKNEVVFTLFKAEQEVDSGDIYLQKSVSFSGYELLDEIREIQAKATLELIDTFLKKYPDVTGVRQVGDGSFYPRRSGKDDRLDIDQTIREQFNHFRIANNDEYPLWFELDGHRYYVKISRDTGNG